MAVYDDRIEITSSGFMPRGLSVEGAKSGHSMPRNQVLSRFFKITHLSEGWGSGIRRSLELCKEYNLRPLEILEIDNTIRVVIFRPGSKYAPSKSIISTPINDLQNTLMDYLERNPEATITDMETEFDVSRSVIRRSLDKLKTLGILTRVGGKQSGRWVVERNL